MILQCYLHIIYKKRTNLAEHVLKKLNFAEFMEFVFSKSDIKVYFRPKPWLSDPPG